MRLPASDVEFDSWVTMSMSNPPSSDRCLSLAQDGDDLWVGTTAGAVRFSSTGPTARLFRRDEDWPIDSKEERGISKRGQGSDWDAQVAFFKKWAKNAVEKVVVLSPGAVWVDLYSGVMIVRDNRKQVFASTEKALAALYATDLKSALAKVANVDRDGHLVDERIEVCAEKCDVAIIAVFQMKLLRDQPRPQDAPQQRHRGTVFLQGADGCPKGIADHPQARRRSATKNIRRARQCLLDALAAVECVAA